MSESRGRVRALLLVAVMAVSVLALGFTAVGPAAAADSLDDGTGVHTATNANSDASADHIIRFTIDQESGTDFIDSGGEFNVSFSHEPDLSAKTVNIFNEAGKDVTSDFTVSLNDNGDQGVLNLQGDGGTPGGQALDPATGDVITIEIQDVNNPSNTGEVTVEANANGIAKDGNDADTFDLEVDGDAPISANIGGSTENFHTLHDAVGQATNTGDSVTVESNVTIADDPGNEVFDKATVANDQVTIDAQSDAFIVANEDGFDGASLIDLGGSSQVTIDGLNVDVKALNGKQIIESDSDVTSTTITNSEFLNVGAGSTATAAIDLDNAVAGDLDITNNTITASDVSTAAIFVGTDEDTFTTETVSLINNTVEVDGDTAINIDDVDDSEGSLVIESVDSKPIVGSGSGGTALTLGSDQPIEGDTTISGLNVTNLGNSGIGITTSNALNGPVEFSSLSFDNVGEPINAPSISAAVDVSSVSINNSAPDGRDDVMMDIGSGSVESATVENIELTNIDTTNLDGDNLVQIDSTNVEDTDVDAITADSIANTNAGDTVLAIIGAGSASSTDDLDVTNVNVTDAADTNVLSVSSRSRFTNIDQVTADNTSTVVSVTQVENARSSVFVNVTNVDANNTDQAVSITAAVDGNDNGVVNIDGVTASNLNTDGIDVGAASADEVNIANTEISDSDSGQDGIVISSANADTTAVSITADVLNVSRNGINLNADVGTVDITDSTIQEAQDGVLIQGVGTAQVNVTSSSFDTFSSDAIELSDGNFDDTSALRVNKSDFQNNDGNSILIDNIADSASTGTVFVNATDSRFLNASAIEVATPANQNGELVLGIDQNWWTDATGPNIDSDSTGDRFAAGSTVNLADTGDADDVDAVVAAPWYDSSALDAFAFGIEGQVTEPDGTSTNYAPADVSISYQGQTSDIDDSTTFTVSASGEYVAVIDEHDGSEFYTASANTPGFAESDAQEDITISGTTFFASQDFTLNDGASLEGFVNNASGEQLQSTGNLQLIDASNDEVLVDGFSTNASGGFTVSLTPDTYDLRVNHPNFDSSNTVEGVELQSGNTTTLATNFTLREDTTADFTATVEFSNGTAIENTDVTFSGSGGVPSSNDASLPVTQTTNSSGIVQFEIPASDTNDAYTITADSANFSNASTGVATAPGDSVSRTFSLEADQQEPSVSVNFTDQTVPNGTEQVTVDSAEFTQADGSAGDYVVVVHTIDEFGAPVGEVSNPIGASGDLTGAEEDITVDLTAADGPIDSITEDVTLRAMLHTTDDNSAFGTRLGSEDAAIDGIEPGDETDDANITVSEDTFVEPAPGTDAESPPQDSDGDGKFEDVNGDNATNFDDVVALAFVLTEKDDLTQQQRDAFDINDDGVVNFDDVVRLAFPGQ